MARSFVVEGNKPSLNAFNLSHNHFTTMNFGLVYPVAWFECVPGDVYDLSYQALFRALPLVSPILNNLTVSLDVYFVPTRLVSDLFTKFITTVDDSVFPPVGFDGTQPTWMQDDDGVTFSDPPKNLDYSNGSIWRCLGFNSLLEGTKVLNNTTTNFMPLDYLRRCYWFIYNEWYRDENLQPLVNFKSPSKDTSGVDQQRLFNRAWRKDYFTAAFTSQQKGISPSVPLTGTGFTAFSLTDDIRDDGDYLRPRFAVGAGLADGNYSNLFISKDSNPAFYTSYGTGLGPVDRLAGTIQGGFDTTFQYRPVRTTDGSSLPLVAGTHIGQGIDVSINSFSNWLSKNNNIDFSNVGTFNVSDLRDMTAIQNFFEDLMRMGSRYIEFLQGMYGVSPTDARLSIPERVGGSRFNLDITAVLQTSETTGTSPQAHQSGSINGLTEGLLGKYKVEEFGYILILADIQPPSVYCQRMPREMMRKSLLEQFSPYFVNLSYQAVHEGELYFTAGSDDNEIFGYQGRYDEMREKMSYASGNVLDTQASYLMLREFETPPTYNSEFIMCRPSNDVFAVTDEDPFIVNFYFDVRALRPLPTISNPGLLDHVYGGI